MEDPFMKEWSKIKMDGTLESPSTDLGSTADNSRRSSMKFPLEVDPKVTVANDKRGRSDSATSSNTLDTPANRL